MLPSPPPGGETEEPDKSSHCSPISQPPPYHGAAIILSSSSCITFKIYNLSNKWINLKSGIVLQVIMGGTTTFVNVIYPVVKERNPEIVYIFNSP